MLPVKIRVDDDLTRWRGSPFRTVVRGVSIADKGHVVTSDKGTVQRRADTRVRLGTRNHQASHPEARQHALQNRIFEGIAIVFLDERLRTGWSQFTDDLPSIGSLHQPIIVVLNPDHWDLLSSSPVHQFGNVGDYGVTFVSLLDNTVLHIHDKEGGFWTILKSGHHSPH